MQNTTITRNTAKKGSTARWLQIGFGLAIIIFLGAGLLNYTASFSERTLPHNIAGLPLTQSMSGDEARREVNQLHGLDITLQDAWIGHYGGQAAIIWVSLSPTENDSSYLMSAMMTRIRQGNAYFGNLQEMAIEGQKVYTVVSQDRQKHYIWQVDRKVIWIAAPQGKEMLFVQEALRLL
ncbi:MAG: hypothetical protein HY673_20830 [Chloroflexi bacterium]|nr:hypothetical protein [Chloroflexota bacterium]